MNHSTEIDFSKLEPREQDEHIAKVNYAILRHSTCFAISKDMLDLAEKYGVFGNTSHGIQEVLRDKK
jgi:hypothetical protein